MSKRICNLIIPALALLMAAGGCRGNKEMIVTTIDGFTQGTYYHVTYVSRDTVLLESEIDSLLTTIVNSISTFNASSRLSRINRNETDSLDSYLIHCIKTARKVSEMSGGMYDITVKPLVEAWGFGTREREQNYQPNLDSLLQFVGFEKISIQGTRLVKSDPRVQIDLNSIASGFAVEQIAALLESRGIERYMVDLGHNIKTRGMSPHNDPWQITVYRPSDEGNAPQGSITVSATDMCIASTGNFRSFQYDAQGRKIIHIINPLTGESTPTDLRSTTVAGADCAMTDAIGTAMIAMGLDGATKIMERNPEVWAYLVHVDGEGRYRTHVSPELKELIKREE